MRLSTTSKIKFAWPAFFLGLAEEPVALCSQPTQNNIAWLGCSLILTPLISSILAAWCISRYMFHSNIAFWATFPLFALVIYFIDRALLASSSNWGMALIRMLIAFIFSLFNSMATDLTFFSTDIEKRFEEYVTRSREDIDSQYHILVTAHQQRIDSLHKEQGELLQEKINNNKILTDELGGDRGSGEEGRGPIYIQQEQLNKDTEQKIDATIAQINQYVKQHKSSIKFLKKEQKAKIDALPHISSNGLIHYMETLHILVFKEGSWITQLYYFTFILLGFAIELAPLIMKFSLPISEYFHFEQKIIKKNLSNRSLGIDLDESLEREQIEQKYELTLRRQRNASKNNLNES